MSIDIIVGKVEQPFSQVTNLYLNVFFLTKVLQEAVWSGWLQYANEIEQRLGFNAILTLAEIIPKQF